MTSFIDAATSVLGLSEDDIIKYAKMDQFEADRMLKAAWDRLNPQTEEDVIRYYTNDISFTLFHLRFLIGMDGGYRNVEFFNKIEKYIPDIRNFRIIDYGCGSGSMGITFANSGCSQVWLADIDLPLFKIVKKMFGDSGKVGFINIDSKYPLVDNYDLILAIDVLEHTVDPQLVLKHLCDHIPNNKFLYIETFFGGYDYCPLHLRENCLKYSDYNAWKKVLDENRLVPIQMNDIGGLNGLYIKR